MPWSFDSKELPPWRAPLQNQPFSNRALPFSLPPLSFILMAKTAAKIARKFVISGRVQGVGYRYFADRCASQLGICGYVKNLWDGSVEVYAIGDSLALEEMKRQLAEGPRSACVTGFMESDAPVDKRYNRFVIEDIW
jgi:acylphosphatase